MPASHIPEGPRTSPSGNANSCPQIQSYTTPLPGRLLLCTSNDISSLGKGKAESKAFSKEFHFKLFLEPSWARPGLGSEDSEREPLSPCP